MCLDLKCRMNGSGEKHYRRGEQSKTESERLLQPARCDAFPREDSVDATFCCTWCSHGDPLPVHSPWRRFEYGKKVEKSFGVASAVGAMSERRFVTGFFREFGDAAIEPPAQRAEPESRAVQEREALGERVSTGDVRNFVGHNRVEFGVVPIAPACGKQNGRAAHTESNGNKNDFGFGEARQFFEPGRSRMKREAAESARIVDCASGAFEAAAENEAQQETREEDCGNRHIDCASKNFQSREERLGTNLFVRGCRSR